LKFKTELGFVMCLLVGAFEAAFAGSWKDGARMDEGRVLLQAVGDGTDIYVAGGSAIAGPKSSFDLYDTISDMWRPLPPMPTARERFGMTAASGRVYVSGGRADQIDETRVKPSNALWAYDTISRDWVIKRDMPDVRVDHAMVEIDDYLYVFGGTGAHASKVYVYDLVKDTWSVSSARMAIPRKGFATVSRGDKIYIIGGVTLEGALSSRVDVFDTASESWSALAFLPKPRVGMAAGIIEGRLHVVGGSVPDPAQTFNAHYSLGLEAEAGASWRKELELPTARHSMASVVVGGQWYVLGGGAAAGFYTLFAAADAVEIFQP
jgi:Kelch motif protein